MPSVKTEAPRSLSSKMIYDSLREGIIRGTYPQGARLAEQRLAAEFNISRVPLREAVPRLESDGFVRTLPRRSAVVNSWTVQTVHELFDLRLCLEVGAARYAARQVAAGASTDRLHRALDDATQGLQTRDVYLVAEQSTEFHEVIADLTGNELMRSMMRSLAGRMMWLFYMTSDLDNVAAHQDHADIVTAIETGNERLAESVAYAHIERDRQESVQVLKRHGLLVG
ncbi:GntR family transcriptional regulator [Mycolicibacterium canariasense]|uniref:GntR family transcriptional regulator n=1 Tax=Mycolicibacterium canariasense TaxID=228230 RepID=A0A117I969_MYCCR|nr:GntR family transcriptional regulator [Mycolicibacterium canariasense]GAS94335.1 GntR family transcriptional regulator [Mycolicibacterium canariasense]